MRFWTAILLAMALVALCVASTGAAPAQLDEDPPGTPVVNDAAGGGDAGIAARLGVMAERFGAFRGEDFKQATLAAALLQAARFPAQLAGATAAPPGIPQWRALGPTSAKYESNAVTLKVSNSGRVRRVLQALNDPDTVYVLTAGGGLWKTSTFSQTNPRWVPLTDSQPTTSGGNMAFGRDPHTLYVGLGDPFTFMPILTGGMIKSTDDGKTWSPFVSLVGASTVQDVAVDTSGASDAVLVATDIALFRSSDGGQSYSPVLGGFFWSFANTSAGWLASSDNGVIYRSIDRGATWAPIPNPGNGYSNAGRTTLGVAAPGDSVVYAFAATPFFASPCGFFFGSPLHRCQRDLFRSTDGGLSWTALGITTKVPTNPNRFQPTMDLMQSQPEYNQMVLVDPGDSSRNTVYLGGELSSAKTTDRGATWTLISDWQPQIPGLFFTSLPYVHEDFHTASNIQLKGSPAIVFGTDGGIFVSGDGGASFDFEKNDGIDSQLAQTVMSSAKNPQTIALGMVDTGTRVRMGSSDVWNQVTGGDGEGIGWSQANNAVTLTTAQFGGYFHSEGLLPNTIGNCAEGPFFTGCRPDNWTEVPPPLFSGDSYQLFTKIATPNAIADPSGLMFFTATARRIYITFDGAQTSSSWFVLARAGSRLPSTFLVRENHHGIALDPTADLSKPGPFGRVAVSGLNGQIAFTLDGSSTPWTVKNLWCGLNAAPECVPGYEGFNTSPAWTSNGGLYVASENPFPGFGFVRVVKSTDNGNTWQAANGDLPDVPVFHLVVDPRDASGNSLYAATSLGVYRTTDGGRNWTLFGAGLPTVQVLGLWISPDGGVLRAATYGRGAWEINP